MRNYSVHQYGRRFLQTVMAGIFAVSSVVPGYAQTVLSLPVPGSMVALSQPFDPPLFKGIKVHPEDPFRLDFILDPGANPSGAAAPDTVVKADSERLIKYFLASLTVPEKELWVNLSPYEKDRIVPEAFGQTEMGRDLLSQDYILKQITASLIYPEGETGKKFWKQVYAKAYETYGTTDIPVDTFNKVWITPDSALVYETKGAALIGAAHLKVQLETDYLATSNVKHASVGPWPRRGEIQESPLRSRFQAVGAVHEPPRGEVSPSGTLQESPPQKDIAKDVMRSIIIPILEKEVNEGANFAQLRQVYNSLILATWYKKKIIGTIHEQTPVGEVHEPPLRCYIDRNKIAGVNIDDPKEAEKIWGRYVEAFKKGAFNLIKEETDELSEEVIPRKYFSGGIDWAQNLDKAVTFAPAKDLPGPMMVAFQKYVVIGAALLALNASGLAQQFPSDRPAEASRQTSRDGSSITEIPVKVKPVQMNILKPVLEAVESSLIDLARRRDEAVAHPRAYEKIISEMRKVKKMKAVIDGYQRTGENGRLDALFPASKFLPKDHPVRIAFEGTLGSYQYNDFRSDRPTVFAVHGTDYGYFQWWTPMLERLSAEYNVFLVVYNAFGPAENSADLLAREVRAVKARYGIHGVSGFVSHSQGALIEYYAGLRDPDIFKGAYIAPVAPAALGSRQALRINGPFPEGPEWANWALGRFPLKFVLMKTGMKPRGMEELVRRTMNPEALPKFLAKVDLMDRYYGNIGKQFVVRAAGDMNSARREGTPFFEREKAFRERGEVYDFVNHTPDVSAHSASLADPEVGNRVAEFFSGLKADFPSALPVAEQARVDRNDKAMNGGIDLNPQALSMQVSAGSSPGDRVEFHLSAADMERLAQSSGFSPKIILIEPMSDIRAFMGN